jgi:replicative DNA helicase
MKKNTKKKLKKFSLKVLKGLAKLIFVYPAKGIWWLIKKLFKKSKQSIKEVKKKKEKKKIQDKRPEVKANYDELKEISNKKGDFIKFRKKLYSNKSTIGIILGARGTGKSAIGMRLLENFKVKTKKSIYALGFKEESLPKWIKVINDIEEIKNDAVILIDEGGIEFSSRDAMSEGNKLLSEILLIARHKDLSVMFIAQNSANLEINAIRQTDYLVLKPSSLLQKDFERKKIKEIYQKVDEDFEELSNDKGLTYLYADTYRGFVSNTLPSFWSDKVSKGYAHRKK